MEPPQRLSPIDAWWNREFPPHSTRRLVFLLAAFPVVGLVPYLGLRLASVRVPFALYAISTVSGAAVLALTWTSGTLRPTGHQRVTSAPRESASDSAGATAPYQPSLHDFGVGLPFAFVSILVTLWAVSSGEETLRPGDILMALVAGAALSGAVVLRYSAWGLALISAIGGLGVGLLLHLVELIWQGEGSFLVSWAIGAAAVAAFAYPMWSGLRARQARRVAEGVYREPPLWVLMSGMLVLTISGALAFRLVLS